jgi:hypothetical protein
VKSRLSGAVSVGLSHRASPPCKAAAFETFAAAGTAQMLAATRDVVALRGEGADGTGAQAGALRAGFARPLPAPRDRRRQLLLQRQGAAIAVPEPVVSMHEHPERRPPERLGARRPRGKRPVGRAAEGIQGFGAEQAREAVEVSAAQRSSGSGAPSRASGDSSKASQFRAPTMPTSTSVRNGASAPTRSASFSCNAPRGANPASSITYSMDKSFELASPRVFVWASSCGFMANSARFLPSATSSGGPGWGTSGCNS